MMLKQELFIDPPIMNAAGTLGFSLAPKSPVDVSKLGAFVTNPISLNERTPAKGARFVPFAGGFLLHTGYPNPGLTKAIRQHARRWDQSPIPVIVNLLAQDAFSLSQMVQRLEGIDSVMGVEISLPPDIDPDSAHEMVMSAIGELPLIVRVPFERSVELAEIVSDADISAVSLSAPRGILPTKSGEQVVGRLYGPSIFPQALSIVKNLIALGISVIGSGGVYNSENIANMLALGATAVQLDAVLWKSGGG